MKQPLLLLLLIFPAVGFSQDTSRKLLLGQVVADSMEVENITVRNKTTNIIAVTDGFGKFAINAREKDILEFSGMAFMTSTIVVEESDFDYEFLKIRLDVTVNQLDEVIIFPIKLTGNLESDSKKIKTKSYSIPMGKPTQVMKPEYERVSPKITTMPVIESSLQGINFVSIGKSIATRLFGKPKPKEKPAERPMETFAETAKNRFSYHFYTVTLKLKQDEIGLFLNYCDTEDVYQQNLLAEDKQFELTDYLIKKSVEFHKMNEK